MREFFQKGSIKTIIGKLKINPTTPNNNQGSPGIFTQRSNSIFQIQNMKLRMEKIVILLVFNGNFQSKKWVIMKNVDTQQ